MKKYLYIWLSFLIVLAVLGIFAMLSEQTVVALAAGFTAGLSLGAVLTILDDL